MIINIFLPMTPPAGTAQQRKISFRSGRTYLPAHVKRAQKAFTDALQPYIPDTPLSGPLKVTQRWYYPFPASRRRKGIAIAPKTTIGDADNIAKLLNDVITRCGIWTDDRLIYSLSVEKYWVDPNTYPIGIEILIVEKQENYETEKRH